MALLDVDDLTVRFGGVLALDGASMAVEAGSICGLIGPNGAGKTTLFNCVTGLVRPDGGRVTFAGADLLRLPAHRVAGAGIARTFQAPGRFRTMTVRENVLVGAHLAGRVGFLAAALRIGVAGEERRLRAVADAVLAHVGLRAVADEPVEGLPFGTRKRADLARALAAQPELLLLDEPAGGLTASEVDELAALLLHLRTALDLTIVLVEHHVAMVTAVSDSVVVLDFGRVLASGPPDAVRRDPRVVEAYLGAAP